MTEKMIDASMPRGAPSEKGVPVEELKLIGDERIKEGDKQCMACGGTKGRIIKVGEPVARMLRKYPDGVFSSYKDIYMHYSCRKGIARGVRTQEAISALTQDAHRIALYGKDAEKLALIENCPLALEERDSNQVPIACTLAINGSEEVLMKLVDMGIGVLRIGDDDLTVFGSVAYIIAGRSEEAKLALVNVGVEAMMIGDGTLFSVAHAIARGASKMVFDAFMALGPAVLPARDFERRPVAFSIACFGPDEACMALAGMGMDVLTLRAGEYATVAYALAAHGSNKVLMALVRGGLKVLFIDKGDEFSVAYALAAFGSEEVQLALMAKGKRVVGIERGKPLRGVAEALAWNGTKRVRDRLENLGYDIDALFC